MEAPPGYANTFLTPSLSKASTKISQPFRGSLSPNLDLNSSGVGGTSDFPLLVLSPTKSTLGLKLGDRSCAPDCTGLAAGFGFLTVVTLSATVSARVLKVANLLRVREGCELILAFNLREGADKNELRDSTCDQTVFIFAQAMSFTRCG